MLPQLQQSPLCLHLSIVICDRLLIAQGCRFVYPRWWRLAMNRCCAQVNQPSNTSFLSRLIDRRERLKDGSCITSDSMYHDVTAGERRAQSLLVKYIGNPGIKIEAREPCHTADGSHNRPHLRQASQV